MHTEILSGYHVYGITPSNLTQMEPLFQKFSLFLKRGVNPTRAKEKTIENMNGKEFRNQTLGS